MTKKEKEDYIAKKKLEREKIQSEIVSITKKRAEFIRIKQKEELEKGGKNRLDNIMLETVREQALKRKFEFK